ncbi:MAG: hypothetical protein R3223_04020 [Longimicrobiales bacterium]|nr:hypothetical protein [Longimicrobiales bacterium]
MIGLVLAVLVLGAAGADGLRTCPHHGGDMGHGFVDLTEHAAHGDAPLADPGPCDHDLGVCETVASDPTLPAARTVLPGPEDVSSRVALPEQDLVRAPEPTFLIPFSTGPPSFLLA